MLIHRRNTTGYRPRSIVQNIGEMPPAIRPSSINHQLPATSHRLSRRIPMQVSMHNWMRAEPVETTIKRLAKYGYDSIEISYDSVELSPGAPGTKAVAQMLKDNGITCYGSITLMFA